MTEVKIHPRQNQRKQKPAGEVRRFESGDHFVTRRAWEEYAEGGGVLQRDNKQRRQFIAVQEIHLGNIQAMANQRSLWCFE